MIQKYVLPLNFGKEMYKHLKNILIYKAKQFTLTICFLKKSLHVSKDNANSMQVDILDM
jgi:hypothetical protein